MQSMSLSGEEVGAMRCSALVSAAARLTHVAAARRFVMLPVDACVQYAGGRSGQCGPAAGVL